jgi:hypothetical protein
MLGILGRVEQLDELTEVELARHIRQRDLVVAIAK